MYLKLKEAFAHFGAIFYWRLQLHRTPSHATAYVPLGRYAE